MKSVVTGYAFAPAQRQVDLSGVPGFDVRRLLAILHVPSGRLVYAAGNPGLGYTGLAGGVLALACDTTAMGAGDPLTVLYDDPVVGQAGEPPATSDAGAFSLVALLKRGLGHLGALAGTVGSGALQVAPRANAPRVSASGALAGAGAALALALDGMGTAVVQLSGTWAGTVAWSASLDGGTSYFPVNLIPYGGGAAVGSATTNGQWEFACGGLTHLRAQMSPYASGSAALLLAAGSGQKSVRVGAPGTNPVPVVGPSAALAGPVVALAPNASTRIAGAGERLFCLINTGTGAVNLGFGTAALPDAGFPLDAAAAPGRMGGSLGFDNGLVTLVDVFAISAAGSSVTVLKG